MSQSWGHSAWKLEPDDYAIGRYTCPGKCGRAVTHATAYTYVTGRQGRVSYAVRKVCEQHAQAFAEKFGVALLEEPPRSLRNDPNRATQ